MNEEDVSILIFLDYFATQRQALYISVLEMGFNPCFLRLLCNCIHGRSSQPGILCFNPCFPGPFCNSVYGKMFRLLSLSCFNPCFLRLLCNLLLVTTKHMGSIISILVFLDPFATIATQEEEFEEFFKFQSLFS